MTRLDGGGDGDDGSSDSPIVKYVPFACSLFPHFRKEDICIIIKCAYHSEFSNSLLLWLVASWRPLLYYCIDSIFLVRFICFPVFVISWYLLSAI